MLAPTIWSRLLKPISMNFPKRELLSLRVVFALPIACGNNNELLTIHNT